MSVSHDIKILIKTAAELTGIKALLSHLHKSSATVRVLTKAVQRLWTIGKAGVGILGSIGKGGMRAFSIVSRYAVMAAGAVAGLVREFTVYNFQMARAWTMMNTGLGGFIKMRRQVAAMSGDLGVLKSQLAGGLYEALSKGVPENNVLTFLRTSGKMAVADGADVKVMVNGLINTMNAFKIKISETNKVADLMATIVKNGGTSYQELASYLSVVAPIAAANGVAFEQIGAAVATLTKQGTPTAVAMTQIRAAIIGVNQVLGDGWSKTMSLQDAFGKVFEKAGGSQNKLKEMMGSIEGVSAVLAMTGKNAQMAKADLNAMAMSAGNLEAGFQKMDQMRHWPKLWQTIRGAMARAGEVLDNVLKPAAEYITKQIAKWRDADKFWDGLQAKLEKMRDTAVDVWAALTKGGEGGNIASGLKDMLVGGLRMGAEKAGEYLLDLAPKVGDMIGTAAAAAIKAGSRIFQKAEAAAGAAKAGEIGKGQGLLYSMSLGLLGSKETKAAVGKRLRAERAGEMETLYAEPEEGESGGKAQFQRGRATLEKSAEKGGFLLDVEKSIDKQIAGLGGGAEYAQKQERARQILQMRLGAEQRDVREFGASVKETEARRPGYSKLGAVQDFAKQEQGDVDKVVKALASLAKGNKEMADAVLAFADDVKAQNKTLESQIKSMRI